MESTFPPNLFPPVLLREVLGSFCSGIVIVTAVVDGPVGFTCQSFTSLSFDPALVSFSASRSAKTWPRIRDVGNFCVNVLAEDQRHISDGFARTGVDKFAGIEWTPSPLGAPVLAGAVAWIDCTLWAEYDGGDHTIAVGAVQNLAADSLRNPLLYFRSEYALHRPLARDRHPGEGRQVG